MTDFHAIVGTEPRTKIGRAIAHLRELIILTQCFGTSADEALGRLRKTINGKPSSTKSPDAPAFGFGT